MPNNDLLKYAGMATQFLATLGVAIFMGYKIDRYLQWKFPLLTLLLPIIALTSLLYKIYIDSSKK
jgi:hypothetical protein